MTETEPQTSEFENNRLNQMLGRVGLVYGGGLAEFGLRHVGWGIPLYRRSTLEEIERSARDMATAIQEVEDRSATIDADEV